MHSLTAPVLCLYLAWWWLNEPKHVAELLIYQCTFCLLTEWVAIVLLQNTTGWLLSTFFSQPHYNWLPKTSVANLPLHFHAHSCTERILSIHKITRSSQSLCCTVIGIQCLSSAAIISLSVSSTSFFPLQATEHVPVVTELCTLISNTFYILYFLPPLSLYFLCSHLMFLFPFILLHYSFSFYIPNTSIHTMF